MTKRIDDAGAGDRPKTKGEDTKKSFADHLGFQAPNLKEQMLNQAAVDSNLEDFMDQDANFIKTQEGYPQFFKT